MGDEEIVWDNAPQASTDNDITWDSPSPETKQGTSINAADLLRGAATGPSALGTSKLAQAATKSAGDAFNTTMNVGNEIPAGAFRGAVAQVPKIQSPNDIINGELMKNMIKGYSQGAMNPQQFPSYQSQLVDSSQNAMDKSWIGKLPNQSLLPQKMMGMPVPQIAQDQLNPQIMARMMAGMAPSALGFAEDAPTKPLDMLMLLLPFLKAGKIPMRGVPEYNMPEPPLQSVTLGERASRLPFLNSPMSNQSVENPALQRQYLEGQRNQEAQRILQGRSNKNSLNDIKNAQPQEDVQALGEHLSRPRVGRAPITSHEQLLNEILTKMRSLMEERTSILKAENKPIDMRNILQEAYHEVQAMERSANPSQFTKKIKRFEELAKELVRTQGEHPDSLKVEALKEAKYMGTDPENAATDEAFNQLVSQGSQRALEEAHPRIKPLNRFYRNGKILVDKLAPIVRKEGGKIPEKPEVNLNIFSPKHIANKVISGTAKEIFPPLKEWNIEKGASEIQKIGRKMDKLPAEKAPIKTGSYKDPQPVPFRPDMRERGFTHKPAPEKGGPLAVRGERGLAKQGFEPPAPQPQAPTNELPAPKSPKQLQDRRAYQLDTPEVNWAKEGKPMPQVSPEQRAAAVAKVESKISQEKLPETRQGPHVKMPKNKPTPAKTQLDVAKERAGLKKKVSSVGAAAEGELSDSPAVMAPPNSAEGVGSSSTETGSSSSSGIGARSSEAPLSESKTIREGNPNVTDVGDKSVGAMQMIPDNASKVEFMDAKSINPKIMKSIDDVRSGPEAKKFWDGVYKKATPIEAGNMVEFKEGKLDNVATVHLTKNCQRVNYLQEMKKANAIPKDFAEESCYGGACYKDRQLDTRLNPSKPKISERNIEFASRETIDKALTPERVKKINASKFVRLGQAGDDSHAIVSGLAKDWLELSKAKGVTKKSVFVTSAYAPTTAADYQALAPYKDRFVIHFTESGYFSKAEILNRMNEFNKARDAGLNVRMRVITNKDQVSFAMKKGDIESIGPMKTPNEQFLFDLIKKHKIQDSSQGEVILETPYHNDFLKNKAGTERSEPTGMFKAVCCQTGKCVTCSASCLLGSRNNPSGSLMSLATAVAGGLIVADEGLDRK